MASCRYSGKPSAYLETAIWARSASVGIPNSAWRFSVENRPRPAVLHRSCARRQRGKQLVECDRVVSYPRAAGVVDRIGDGGGSAADSEFADALAFQWIGSVIQFRKKD